MQSNARILLTIAAIALLGLGALVVLDGGSAAGAEILAEPTPVVTMPVDQAKPESRGEELVSEMKMTPRVDAPPGIDPTSGTGMISGRIAISTRIIDRLRRYTIVVQEDVNTNGRADSDPEPFRKIETFKADMSRGTPYFDIADIPFCKHPYKVSVAAEGINGSSAHVYISEQHPRGKDGDVQLSLTPGAYFSLVLRDQRQNPRAGLPVHMVPAGESVVRRATQIGESDRNGYLLFENVVKGDYVVFVGPRSAPLAPPQQVKVFPSFTSFSATGRPQSQGLRITVPDGHDVVIDVQSKWGYGVENAEVKFWQLEAPRGPVSRYYEFKSTTDRGGRCTFEHVPFGVYQVNVQSPHNGVRDQKFKVEKDQAPPTVRLTMPR